MFDLDVIFGLGLGLEIQFGLGVDLKACCLTYVILQRLLFNRRQ